MRLIDEIAYQEKIAKIPIEERTFVKAWETAQDMPTIDAVPVVRGEWITNSDYPDTVICSLCGWRESVWWADKGTNYCPNCGAKMEGERRPRNER